MSVIKLPRVALGHWPTPLHELPRLSATLGGPRIFVKRDDLTGLALGGNKCRKLEYELGDAQRRGIDTLITTGSSQSNSAVQIAAAARKLGMEPYLILIKGTHVQTQGNLLLHNIFGSKVNILNITDPLEMFSTVPKKMNELADKLRHQGRKPLVIPAGVTTPLGAVGWVSGAEEIAQQLKEQKIDAQYVVMASGSAHTQVGLMLGIKYLKLSLNVIGISVLNETTQLANTVVNQVNDTAKLLGLDISITQDEVTLYDDYVGQGYGIPTKECIEAIRVVAQTEGIFLDPVYTGKAMSGLIGLIKRGYFTKKDTVLFIHSGGVAADFAYSVELSK